MSEERLMMIIVLTLKGEGTKNADEVSVKTFQTEKQAQDYISKTNNLMVRYWTAARIVKEDARIITYVDAYK